MAISPTTKEVMPDPVYFTGKRKATIMVTYYYGGVVAYLPELDGGLCGKDLRGLGIALLLASVRVDELNRQCEKRLLDVWDVNTEEIPVKAI